MWRVCRSRFGAVTVVARSGNNGGKGKNDAKKFAEDAKQEVSSAKNSAKQVSSKASHGTFFRFQTPSQLPSTTQTTC